MAKLRLAGKTALITGGSRGIGLSLVEAFLAEGARVAFSGTTAQSVERALATLGARDDCAGMVGELSAPGAAVKLVGAAVRRFGALGVLVNNAGVGSGSTAWDITLEEWDRVLDVNLRAVFFASQAAGHAMRAAGGGAILNVASIAGQNGGVAGSPAYAAAKAGVIGLTRSLARQFAAHGIRVNCLSPADIETDLTADWPHELRQRLVAMTPLGRFGRPDELAGAAVFLASDEASFITGQTLAVNGGAYMG
jgi:NAD(P)-dependent dehydrogenase (short-subunit alcohol dehydrogenase family)